MEIRHLKYFLAISKLGSFTKASEELFVTQPTLSHQMRQLEAELGCELLDRSSRSIRLTGAGEIFSVYANRIIREIEDGKLAIQSYHGLQVGSVVIGAISAFTNNLLPPILADFSKLYPGIKVKLIELPTGEMQRKIRDGDISFGLGYGPVSTESIQSEELFREDLMLIVAKTHEFAKRPFVSLHEVAMTKLALLSVEYISRRLIDMAFLEILAKPNITMEMNSIDAILETIGDSDLTTIMTKRMMMNHKKLTAITIKPEISRTVAIFKRENANLSPAAEVLKNMLISKYKQDMKN
jgi:LysR family transcriptional regulator, cyn operon transcriptional activator